MKEKLLILPIFFIIFLGFLLAPTFKARAATAPIRILLVPGHDNTVWGAQYGNIKEADMNLVLATKIYNLLKQDKRFNVYITRDSGGYTKTFSDYLANKEDIATFELNAKEAL